MCQIFSFIITIFTLNCVNSAKILTIIPTPSISHQVPFRPLTEALVKRGHHVTLLTPDPVNYDPKEYENLTQIDVRSFSYKLLQEKFNFVELHETCYFGMSVVIPFWNVMLEYTDLQLKTPQMQKLLKDPNERFDLCFVEMFAPPMLAVKDRFNCSLIVISSTIAFVNFFDSVGNPSNPILYPDIMNPYLKPYTFMQKMFLVFQDLYFRFIHYYMFMSKFDHFAKEHFGDQVRPIADIEKDIDMLFLNVNPILGDIRPTVPTIVYINGFHLKENTSLPLEYQNILDKATNGVIYFSLGSNVKSTDLPIHKRKAFMDAFVQLPYTILWKWENETLDDKPTNVIIAKWMPQQDILAHPNIRAFITQGGQQSMEEAIHHKVPLIGLPFIGDQFLNVKKMVQFGIGVELHHKTLCKEAIVEAIEKVVKNPEYKEKISKLSVLMNDQPQKAIDKAVWWTEYVLRHKGASHLKAPAVGVPFYEYFLLDIIGFVLGCIATVIVVFVSATALVIGLILNLVDSPKYTQLITKKYQ